MSKRNDKKLNNNADLAEFKSLIGDSNGDGDFSLDDILAEYGTRRKTVRSAVPLAGETSPDDHLDLPWPEAKPTKRSSSKVVAFPGAQPPVEEEPDVDDLPPEPLEYLEQPEFPEEEPDADDVDDQIIEFPQEESVLSSFIRDISDKADQYADQMFQESERVDPEQVRRLEELIPGTDQEDEDDWEEEPPRRRPREPAPPPPDLSPQELARTYSKGLKGLRIRTILVFFLCIPALAQLLVARLGFVWPAPLDSYQVQVFTASGLLLAGTLLSMDVLLKGVARAFRGKMGMDTLLFMACIFTLVDGVMLALYDHREGHLPYSAVVLVGLLFTLHGNYHKKCALRLSCRTAASTATPYRVTLDEGKWNGRDTYAKWRDTSEGFGSQMQMDDGAQGIFRVFCPLLFLACILFSLLSSVGMGHEMNLFWCLSATFTASASFGAALIFGRPFHKVARRLSPGGGVLAGWPGIAHSRRGDRVLIYDLDLFPPGYVELNGIKVLGDYSVEKVTSYTATLIRDSGSGLTQMFYDLMRTQGGLFRKAEHLCCYEGGGLSASIRGDQVLVGSAAFMKLMEIPLPQGLNVKNAVFCAINEELSGIFALNYTLPDTIFPALETLIHEKIGPVLATRDFNLIPAMLKQRFKLAADKMDFPPIERRRELSDIDQPHSEILTALLCREGLLPFVESIVGAKRLRRATRVGAVLSCIGSLLGVLLTYYLTSVSAYTSLSPLNLLIFMLLWLLPIWFLTSWVPRY